MKPVTQERILKALDKLFARTHNSKTMKQTQVFALHGLKSLTGSLQPIDSDKLELELSLIEGDRPTSRKEFSAKYDHLMDIHHGRRSRILNIQVKHRISGLEWQHIEQTETSAKFYFLTFNPILRQIPSDMQLLAKHKPYVVQHWIDYAVTAALSTYQDIDGEWQVTPLDQIWAKSSEFGWAMISLDKYYLSPRMMRVRGFDSPRNKPEMPDDELHIEFDLTIGKGEDFESIDADILWFRATNYQLNF
jgi:hypothetical protein